MKQLDSQTPPLIITGALFQRNHAQALWPMMQTHTPRLCQWLAESRAQTIALDEPRGRCTAHEAFVLRQCGFKPQDKQSLSTGMALILALESPLWQQLPAENPVWVTELVHMAPGREGASLIPGRLLSIETDESQALLESVQSLLEGTDFHLHPLSNTRWLLQTSAQMPANPVTAELAFQTTVQDWWDTSTKGRTWRQWANEVQMLWFTHPVNERRQKNGLLPINGLWLMGGAAPKQLSPAPPAFPKIIYDLEAAFREQDWSAWLQALVKIEQQWFASPPAEVVLAGAHGYLHATHQRQTSKWRQFFTRKKTGQLCWLDPF